MFKLENTNDYEVIKNQDGSYNVTVNPEISDIISFLDDLYSWENQLSEEKINGERKPINPIVFLRLKNLNNDKLVSAIKYSLTRKDLRDPIMILNVMNLIKIYNNLSDEFFSSDDIYFNDLIELMDIKQELFEELEEFSKKLSIYFLSLIKSYNKTEYSELDDHTSLDVIYKVIFSSYDFITLAGIFSVAPPINTEECIFIDDSVRYLTVLMEKNTTCFALSNLFLTEMESENKQLRSF